MILSPARLSGVRLRDNKANLELTGGGIPEPLHPRPHQHEQCYTKSRFPAKNNQNAPANSMHPGSAADTTGLPAHAVNRNLSCFVQGKYELTPDLDHQAIPGMEVKGSYNTLLRQFAKGSTAVSAAEAAKTVARIAASVSSGSAITQESRNSAKLALTELCRNPNPEAVPALLSVCEIGVSLHVVDAFLLSSFAWKAVVATCLKFGQNASLVASLRLQALQCAIDSAGSMLRSLTGQSGPADASGLSAEPSKALKIARFHCTNAAKCAKAFASVHDWKQASRESLADVVSKVLGLVAHVSFLVSFESSATSGLRQDVHHTIAPALGATLRFVLCIVGVFSAGSVASQSKDVLSNALDAILGGRASPAHEDSVTRNGVLQLIGILHLIRYATSDTRDQVFDSKLTSTPSSNDNGILHCRSVFEPLLLRSAFNRLEAESDFLLTSRHVDSGTTMFDIVSVVIEECIVVADAEAQSGNGSCTALEELLFSGLTGIHPLSALVSSRSIIRIAGAAHTNAKRRQELMVTTLQCARLALSICPGQAERRWIPMAGRLGHIVLKHNEELCNIITGYQDASGVRNAVEKTSTSILLEDPVLMRLIAAICGMELAENVESENVQLSPQRVQGHFNVADRVLQACMIDKAKLTSSVKNIVLGNTAGGIVAEAALYVLPYLMDARASSAAALVCLKREESSRRTTFRALNILNPAVMSPSAVQTACSRVPVLIPKLGAAVCTPIIAFVTRACLSFHSNISPSDWQRLSSILEVAVSESQKAHSPEMLPTCLRYAALQAHVTVVLEMTNSLQSHMSNKSTRPPLLPSIVSMAEEAQERLQSWKLEMGHSHRTRVGEAEADLIQIEMGWSRRYTSSGAEQQGHDRQAGFSRQFELFRQKLFQASGRGIAAAREPTSACSGVKIEICELRRVLQLLEDNL